MSQPTGQYLGLSLFLLELTLPLESQLQYTPMTRNCVVISELCKLTPQVSLIPTGFS